MGTKTVRQTELDAVIARLMALKSDDERRSFVRQNPSCEWDSIISTVADRVWQELRVDAARAQGLADMAICVAEVRGSKAGLAKALRSKANALYVSDQHAAAIEMHQQAAALFEEVGDPSQFARTLSSSLQPLLLLGRYEEALAASEQARAIFSREQDSLRLARLEINIGNIYHRQDRFAEALAYYERAYAGLAAHDDAEGMAAVLSNLSLCYISLNEFSRALDFHKTARQHCKQKAMPILVAYADYNIAYVYFLRGEYGRAVQMLREASISAHKAQDAYQMALCNLDLSEIYLELNLVGDAADLGRQAHESFQQLGFGYEAAKALAFAALAASRQGQAFEGIKLFAKAREMFVRDQNQVWPSLIDLYQALVFFNEGRLFEARGLCNTAREFFRTSGISGKAALADLLMVRIALKMNDVRAARQHCQSARGDLERLQSRNLTYQTEFLAGEIERASGDEQKAFESYLRARDALEVLRGSLRGEELKIAFFQNKLEVYEQLVNISMKKGELEQAFTCMQQGKSRSLTDQLIQPTSATGDDSGQSELVRSIRTLREELNWYYNLIEREQLRPEERSITRIQKLEQEARQRENALTRALKDASVVEANQAGFQASLAVSLEEVREAIPRDTVLLEYFSVQERYVACAISRDAIEIRPVTVHSRVKKLVQLLQFQLSKFRLDPGYVTTFQDSLLESTLSHLKGLYEELIAPIADLLQGQRLVVLPHGLLHYVPFHALHDGREYLIDRYSISYAPSASVYALCRSKVVNRSGGSLIFGIDDAQAPQILEEVRALSGMLPEAKLFRGAEATEKVLRSEGKSSRILHIATHGYFRQDNPMFSSIRLGNSYLSLYDLYQFELPVELVTLSGCATGLNVVAAGDELLGLVRGLLQAGAQSLVLSLWDVHDESTKQFMINFYGCLQVADNKASALRKAMLAVREEWAHPYYWAPFLLIGKE